MKPELKLPIPWVAMMGPDGSGKSSVLQNLEEEFTSPWFTGVRVIYRRPNLSGRPPARGGPVIDHYGRPPHGWVKSVAKLSLRALDWWLGYHYHCARQLTQGYLVLLDRHYFLDVSIDPLRYRYSGPRWLAYRLGQLLPRPDLFILLDAPPEVLQSRKQEVSPEECARQRRAYLELMENLPNSYVVDAARPFDEVVTQVKQIILGFMAARSDIKAKNLTTYEEA